MLQYKLVDLLFRIILIYYLHFSELE
jgi:hypothetical protein